VSNKFGKHGIRVKKGQSALEAFRASVPHWIHKEIDNPKYIGGKMYLPQCTCSECGFESNQEKDTCPHCNARMVRI